MVTIKYDHATLCKFLAVNTLHSEVSYLETKIVSVSHVTFEQIKVTIKILADHIFRLRSIGFYDVLDPEEWGKNIYISCLMNFHPWPLNKKGRQHL